MIGYMTINGVSSRDFNVILSDAGVYNKAERDIETFSVPGRSGDLVIDNNRFKNINLEYQCAISGDFDANFTAFMNYILSQKGYLRIEDSFHPEEYVMAMYTGETDTKRVKRDRVGTFSLMFNRKPQRYLKEGEKPIRYVADPGVVAYILYNNYQTTALPIVRIVGTGTLNIGTGNDSTRIQVLSANSYTDIDCENMEAYRDSTNCNGNIRLLDNKFFSLPPGEIGINIGTGITKVLIWPRWWRL